MKLEEIMRVDVIQVSPGESIGEAAKRMREKSVGCLVVTADGAIKGVITDRDLLACIGQSHDPYRCGVALHMSRPVIVLRPEEDHLTAANVMCKKRIKRLPIAKDGKLLGIISLSDLAALAESDLERLESSTLFVSYLIKTHSAFRPAFVRYLEKLHFTGDVHAMAEGTIFFPNEPILRVTAPLPQAQLVESRLINLLHYQTLIMGPRRVCLPLARAI